MFKDEYRRQQEAVHAEEALIRRTLNAAARRKAQPRASWKPALVAALCVLLVAVPVCLQRPANRDVTSTNSSITSSPAPDFMPIGHETQVDGMTLRYLGSFSTDGSRYIMLTLHGDNVSEEMSLCFALSSRKTGQHFQISAQQLAHDADRKLSTFVIAIHEKYLQDYLSMELTADGWRISPQPCASELPPEDDHLTLTLLEYGHYRYQPLEELALEELTVLHVSSKAPGIPPAAPTDSEFQHREMKVEIVGTPDWTDPPLYTPIEGYHIMTIRNIDNQSLIVETQMDEAYVRPIDAEAAELSAWLYLLPRDIDAHPWQSTSLYENIYAAKTQLTWKGDESNRRYLQHIFPLDGIDLDRYMLGVYGHYRINLPDASSALSFSLGN